MLDWTDLSQVKAYADKLARIGKIQQTVILRPGQDNYNIIHTQNEARLLHNADVVYRTGSYVPKKKP